MERGDEPDFASLPERLQVELAGIHERPPAEWAEAVDAMCREHPDHAVLLRRWLEAALHAEQRIASVFEESEQAGAHYDDPPEQIGPYRILETLGQGGMGQVYRAEQKTPVRRMVAIKVIKLGMDSRNVLARFELERRALAAMSHSAIAKVFDCGTTDRAQPYFVMELVEGLPLNEYCDRHRLDLVDRVVLFQQVCAGVHHAHQKGIVHRDLKPGNVLVAREGDRPVPKILDFGVAKVANRDLLAQTIFTEHRQILGTPEYMAPEQARFDHEVIDTRADVYSLGVMLYELLSGRLPFSSDELRRSTWIETQRVLSEVEPPKPSTRASVADEETGEQARLRGTTPPALSRELRGDLDWVVLKAMAKEPERRYDSAAELAADLRRYLVHEPVIAGPPSVRYRLGKAVRKYRTQVVAAGLLVIALAAGAVGTTLFAIDANAAHREADQRSRQAERVGDFLKDLFRYCSPEQSLGQSIPIDGLLQQGVFATEHGLSDEPEVQWRLLAVLAEVHTWMGDFESALRLADRAVALEADLGEPVTADAVQLHLTRGAALASSGRSADAVRAHEVLGSRASELLAAAPDLAADYRIGLARALDAEGRTTEATRTIEDAVESLRPGGENERLAEALHTLAVLQSNAAKHQPARLAFEEAIAIHERLRPEGFAGMPQLRHDYARCLLDLGDAPSAKREIELALTEVRRIFGDGHPWEASMRVSHAQVLAESDGETESLAATTGPGALVQESHVFQIVERAENFIEIGDDLFRRGKYVEAADYLERALSICRGQLAGDHDATARALTRLAATLSVGGLDNERAIVLGREGAEMYARVHGEGAGYAEKLARLGWAEAFAGQPAPALEHARQALALFEAEDGFKDDQGDALTLMAHCMVDMGDHQQAERLARDALARIAPDHWLVVLARYELGRAMRAQNELEDAVVELRGAAELAKIVWPGGQPTEVFIYDLLAATLYQLRQSECVAVWETAYEKATTLMGPQHFMTPQVASNLGVGYDKAGKTAEAEAKLLEGFHGFERIEGAGGPRAQYAAMYLAGFYERAGNTERQREFEAKLVNKK